MRKPELSGRMPKWSIHLSGYGPKFEPRTAIKSQALSDFVSDFSPTLQPQADKDVLTLSEDKGDQRWVLYVDGDLNMRGTGVGLVLRSPQGEQIVQAVRCKFWANNNEAEYETLILGLQLALDLRLSHIEVYNDSQLIVNHQVPRDQNVEADTLTTLGATFKLGKISTIPIVHMVKPAVYQQEHDGADKATYSQWTHEAVNDVLPADKKEVRGFKMNGSRFVLIDNILFRKSLAGPYLRCLKSHEAQAVMQDIHSRECGNHAGGRSLSNKALRQGYFWPTMSKVYMLAPTDYLSKWIEAEAFPQVLERYVISFIKQNIIYRFRIPSEIVCDNGSQFVSNKTEAFCARWNFALFKSTPRNPLSNGQAESGNKIVMENLKKRLE
ncbi:uncharacterized protein LOC141630627 [Silene latifolia]|uniref:uncharacterized protein LOC141630627 n=1 Tax=Silene latifolia TaxID=37657 RepID=UPI003D773144